MLKSLQAGRAIAAVGVALFHLSVMIGESRYGGITTFQPYAAFGSHGVDFFFVLSGFIIMMAHFKDIGRPNAWPRYAYRRGTRLYPVYWIYTAVFLVVLQFSPSTTFTPPSSLADWLTIFSLFRFSDINAPLMQAWTLFHEMAFYLIFSILILNKRLGILAFTLFFGWAIAAYQFPTAEGRTPLAVYTSAFNLYFGFGMLAFWLYRKAGTGLWELLSGLALIIATAVAPVSRPDLAPMAFGLGFALVIAGATKLERAKWLAVPATLAFVGDASYTVYLVHQNLEGLLLKVATRIHAVSVVGPAAVYFLVAAMAVGGGCLIYVLVERPLLRLLKDRWYGSASSSRIS